MATRKSQFFPDKARRVAPIYIENLAFLCMPFLDLAFLDSHGVEIILVYGMMLPWFYITEISINSIVILVSGEEISRRVQTGQFLRRRIHSAALIVIAITGTMTIVAAAVTTHVIAPRQFWSIFPYFVVFTLGFAIYAPRKMAAIEAISLGNPGAALTGSILAVGINLALNMLAQQAFDTASLTYVLAIASSTCVAYLISWVYIRSKIADAGAAPAVGAAAPADAAASIMRPLKTQFASSLELVSSQSYALVIISLLISANPDFVYVRAFLVQFFLVVTATGIAVSIYSNNVISERLAEGSLAVHGEVRQNIADILKVSLVQSLFVVAGVYVLFRLGVFGRELSDAGIQSLVIGAAIYVIYEPVKAMNIMLLTVIRRLHIAAVPTAISVASNIVAVGFAVVATWIIMEPILVFTTLIAIVFAEELFRCLSYYWFIQSRLRRDVAYG